MGIAMLDILKHRQWHRNNIEK